MCLFSPIDIDTGELVGIIVGVVVAAVFICCILPICICVIIACCVGGGVGACVGGVTALASRGRRAKYDDLSANVAVPPVAAAIDTYQQKPYS